jgi:hypothetical protein
VQKPVVQPKLVMQPKPVIQPKPVVQPKPAAKAAGHGMSREQRRMLMAKMSVLAFRREPPHNVHVALEDMNEKGCQTAMSAPPWAKCTMHVEMSP